MDWYICLRRLNVGPILVMKISIEYILWKSQVRNVCWYLQSEHINLKLYIWENICMGKYSNVMNNKTLGTHLNWCGHNIHIHFNLKWNGYASSIICTFSFHLDSTLWLFTSAGWKHSTGASVNLIMAWIYWGYLWLQHLKLYFNPEFISRYLFIYQSNSRLLKHRI